MSKEPRQAKLHVQIRGVIFLICILFFGSSWSLPFRAWKKGGNLLYKALSFSNEFVLHLHSKVWSGRTFILKPT